MNAPVAVPFLDLGALYRADAPDYDAAYRRVMDHGWWIQGPELQAFEAEFAQACGVAHAVGVGNGLDALALALRAAGIGPGHEVLVPAHTFIATWLAVAQVGAVPRAVEPAPGGFNITAAGVARALGPHTRAVLPVHLYGQVADGPALADLCRAHGLLLLEDAAQAHGAQQDRRPAGSFGTAAAFSFYPGKNLGAFGDGGAVVTDDDALAERVRKLRNYGGLQRYQHEELGGNSRLDELQAAFLRVRLARLAAHNAARQAVATQYQQRLDGLPGLTLPDVPPGHQPAWHLYVVRCAHRDALQAHLARQGVQTLVHYPRPVYRFAPFAAHGPAHRTLADALCDEILSLPMSPLLTPDQVDRVCDAVTDFFTP